MNESLIRCGWAEGASPNHVEYHDTEWGVPVHDDRVQFEFLILEGAQAGLSWAGGKAGIPRRSDSSLPMTESRRSSGTRRSVGDSHQREPDQAVRRVV